MESRERDPRNGPAGASSSHGGPGPSSRSGRGGSSGPPDATARQLSLAGGEGEQDHVIVLPPAREGDPSPRRGARFARWAAVALALLAAFALYEAGRRGWLEPGRGTVGVRAPAAGAAAAPDGRSEAETRFREAADALEGEVQDYGVRRSDFERNRIGCAALRTGYRAVDRRFVALSVLLRERGDGMDAAARRRYRELSERVDEVNRHYDGTGCRTAG